MESEPMITPEEDIRKVAEHLATTARGRSAMRHVLAWLDDDGLGLDGTNQAAIAVLLNAAWGPFAGTVRDAMRLALEEGQLP